LLADDCRICGEEGVDEKKCGVSHATSPSRQNDFYYKSFAANVSFVTEASPPRLSQYLLGYIGLGEEASMELSLQAYFDIGVSYGLGDSAFERPPQITDPDILGIGIRNPLGLGITHNVGDASIAPGRL
jgi:hypothetical protein